MNETTNRLDSGTQILLPTITPVPVYQYYAINRSGGTKYHYSTRSDIKNGWTYETIPFYAFGAQDAATVPVYQYYAVYADGSVKYCYSTDPKVGNNWKKDHPAIAFYAYQKAQPFTQPLYQYYAPDQDGGIKYFYSTDPNANQQGWQHDFIACHVAIAKTLDFSLRLNKLIVNQPPGRQNLMIQRSEPFSLAVDFTGSGAIFKNIANQKYDYQIDYFAEGIGRNTLDLKLGTVSGKLIPGQVTYRFPETHLDVNSQDLQAGLYKTAAILSMPGIAYSFIAGLVLQVLD